jgi:hypothetical protein
MKKEHVVEAIALALLTLSTLVVWYNLTSREKRAYIESSETYQEFGIVAHEDIYIDNMEKGKYTSHGRLINTK